jgi:hypothetical protein
MLCNPNNNTASTVSHASYPSEIDPPKAAAAVGFRLLANGALVSSVSAVYNALPLPLKVIVTRTLDLGEVIIASGSTGTVVSQNASTGVLTLLMDAYLNGWGNVILLAPFDTDDILSAFHILL